VATYLYGIVRRPAGKPQWGTGVGDPPQPLRPVVHGSIAALVSDFGGDERESEGRALRRDLRAHEEAVRHAMSFGTILPVSFGTVFEDDGQLVDELLEPSAAELDRLLRQFDGLVELMLKVEFVEDAVIQLLLQRDQELRAWRESSQFGGTEEQIAFGQALAEAIEQEGAARAEGLLARLTPLAEDVRIEPAAAGTGVLKASFLVQEGRLPEFDRAVEELGERGRGVLEFDFLGPLPPYSFVEFDLAQAM
jgi:hypothetical protein